MRNNLNTLMQVYRGHQFIGSTTEGVTLAARNYPVRKLVYDQNTYIGFVNAANEVKLFDEYMRCTGMTTEDLYKIPSQLPEILVEVSPENTFTRVNWTSPVEGGKMNADLGLKYPANPVNVQTPKEFMTLNQVLQMEGDFLNQEVEVDDTVVDEDCPACDPGAEDCVCEDTEVEQDAEY